MNVKRFYALKKTYFLLLNTPVLCPISAVPAFEHYIHSIEQQLYILDKHGEMAISRNEIDNNPSSIRKFNLN